jgi:hypothetical protein
MTDILLTQDLELEIVNGDLGICEDLDTDFQDLNLLLNFNTGDSKQYPTLGTNLITWKNGEFSGLLQNLKTQFTFAKLPVDEIIVDNETSIKLKLKGNYRFVDLSIL